ncbi:hypothetical protein JRO89_XS14G0020400 [Xanthoceras sorbifolium]|uniref:Uncharacterized protein n=1 Tax=Xanthoceras sorbifolium TaxID=99658 RepID=A0ABQ8H3D8_9ROSI|nr:hypothetical protein JRO89_XS14G0020400 [Xanthoceras sorbifolium]
MALSSSFICARSTPVSFPEKTIKNVFFINTKSAFRVSAVSSTPKARFVARRKESVSVRQLQRPLIEYMSLPASQYSVLDAERIERVDDKTFRCYVYRFKFFAFEVCPVLLVRVEEQPNGCCIKLLSCKVRINARVLLVLFNRYEDLKQREIYGASNCGLELHLRAHRLWLHRMTSLMSSVSLKQELDHVRKKAQKVNPGSSMVNQISCDSTNSDSAVQQLTSDAIIEVSIEIPFAFRALPVEAIESTGTQVLEQILKLMLPRFMAQLVKDYQAWATGDISRQPLGTGEI